jgi:hypothetical protein
MNKIKLLIIELVLISLNSYLIQAINQNNDETTGMIQMKNNLNVFKKFISFYSNRKMQ